MEYVNIYSVRSSARLLEALEGKMIRVGTDLSAKKTVAEFTSERQAGAKNASSDGGEKESLAGEKNAGKKPFLLVLGNEEHGISEVVKKNCDELVIIPWAGMAEGKENVIDSLNVAQASSILFDELTK